MRQNCLKYFMNPIRTNIRTAHICLRNNAGMSLVEIMIVLGIIGTILGLIGNSIVGANEKAKAKEAKMAMAQMMNGLSTYESDCGKYPEALDDLIKPSAECQTWEPIKLKLKAGKILDPWSNEFIYSKSETGDVVLKSYGKDGKEGGTGVNADLSTDDSAGSKGN